MLSFLRRSPWPELLLLGVSFVIALGVAEIVLRTTHLAPAGGVHTVDLEEFDAVPGMLSPGQHLVDWRNADLPHEVSVNALGYRGRAFARQKQPGELRILFVGDSFTYGDYVADHETVPALLETALGGTCPSVTVVNAGLAGSTIVGHAAMIARAASIEPDLILLMFHENDVEDLADPIWHQLEANRIAKSRFPLNIVYGAFRDLALWSAALRLRAVLRDRNSGDGAPDVVPLASDEDPPGLRDRYAERLRMLRDSLRREDLPLVTTAFPIHHSIYRDTAARRMAWFADLVAREGIPYIDIFTPLVQTGAPETELYLLPHDGHASPAGNRIAAGTLAAGLLGMPTVAALCRTAQ